MNNISSQSPETPAMKKSVLIPGLATIFFVLLSAIILTIGSCTRNNKIARLYNPATEKLSILIERELFPELEIVHGMTGRKLCKAKDITFLGNKVEFVENPCRLITGGNKDDHFPLNPFTAIRCNIWNAGESCYSFVVLETFTNDGHLNSVLAHALNGLCRKDQFQLSKQNQNNDTRDLLCEQIKTSSPVVFYFNKRHPNTPDDNQKEQPWARAEFLGTRPIDLEVLSVLIMEL